SEDFVLLAFHHTEHDAHTIGCDVSNGGGRGENVAAISQLNMYSGPLRVWFRCFHEAAKTAQFAGLRDHYLGRARLGNDGRCFEGNPRYPAPFRLMFSKGCSLSLERRHRHTPNQAKAPAMVIAKPTMLAMRT